MNARSLLVVFLGLAAPATVCAQPSQLELARAELLRQADEARTRGDHARALEFATRAGSLRMHSSVRLMIAQEHNALGHVLDALASASQCAREAEIDPALHNRERILSTCLALANSLTARVGRVIVEVPSPPTPGLHVRVAGNDLADAVWGVPYPVLPGSVTIDAEAEGYEGFHQSVSVGAGENRAVRVSALRRAPPVVVARPVVLRQPPLRPPPEPGRALAGPIVVMSAGVAALALTGVFYGLRSASLSDRDATVSAVSAQCDADPNRCDYADALSQDATARSYNLATNISLGVGIAAVAAGTLWLILAPRRDPPRVSWFVAPQSGGWSLGLGGAL